MENTKIIFPEMKRRYRFLWIMFWSSVALCVFGFFNTEFYSHLFSLDGSLIFLYLPVMSAIGLVYFKKRMNSFIEWKDGKLTYKLRANPRVELSIDEISDIEIGLDITKIKMKDGSMHEINIADIQSYDKRILVKDKLKEMGGLLVIST